MARSFTITAAAADVALDKNRGGVAFTVSNVSNHPVRGRARLVPLGEAKETWLVIGGDAERDFKTNDTQQFNARIVVPAGTPSGKYSFRLDMIGVADPDEDYTEGPVAAFEVRPSEAPTKSFPVWVLPVAALVLILGGVGAWLLTRDKEPEKDAVKEPEPVAIVADFTATHEGNTAPLNVRFTDKSIGDVDSHEWNFGDGAASRDQNPEHTFQKLGLFDVEFRVRDKKGNTHARSRQIKVDLATPKPLRPAGNWNDSDFGPPLEDGRRPVRFRWEPAPLATRYRIQLQISRGINPAWMDHGPGTEVGNVTTNDIFLSAPGSYRWIIIAISDNPAMESKPSEPTEAFRYPPP